MVLAPQDQIRFSVSGGPFLALPMWSGTLLESAAPLPAKKCGSGTNYHGECPKEWGAVGIALQGFGLDGLRIETEWHSKDQEPLQKTVKAWVAFLKDHKNFENTVPIAAGVVGAPDLDGFTAHIPAAPVKR